MAKTRAKSPSRRGKGQGARAGAPGERLHLAAGEGGKVAWPVLDQLPPDILAALLDHADPLYLAQTDGRIVFTNAGYRDLAHLLGEEAWAPVPPETILNAASEGRTPFVTRHTVERQGCIYHYQGEHRALMDSDGRLRALVATFSRQDEDRSQRETLRATRERLDDISRLVSDWIWEIDRDMTITFVSPRVTDVLGFHPVELVGRQWTNLVGPADPLAGADLERRPPRFRDREVAIAHKDGSARVFRLSGIPIFDADSGKLTGFRGTAQDISGLKAREHALMEAKHTAEEANQAKGHFLAQISHELRTPLNAIIGFSEIMKMEALGPLGNDTYRQYVGDVMDSARHLLQIINDVLDVSKIEAGKFQLNESWIDPVEISEQALRTIVPHAEEAGVGIDLELPDVRPRLRADPTKLRQILVNLLSNAVKFSTFGGRLALRCWLTESGRLCFAVADNGIGMNPEEVEVALTPFGQIDSSISRRCNGTGLGLPLCNALVELHGGSLKLDSSPGAGTTAIVSLPASRVMPG